MLRKASANCWSPCLSGLLVLTTGISCVVSSPPKASSTPPAPDDITSSEVVKSQTNTAAHKADETSPALSTIKWFEDDYEAALADAIAHQRPLLIDYWADWCHTCLSMKHTVLRDPGLRPLADRMTWLSIDTEKPSAQAIMQRFAPLSWPTFYIINPHSETSIARFSGGASLPQFRSFVSDAESSYQAALVSGGQIKPDSPLGLVQQGDLALERKDTQGALSFYQKALVAGGPNWPRRSDVYVLILRSQQDTSRAKQCIDLAWTFLPNVEADPASTEFFYFALQCANAQSDTQNRPFYQAASTQMRKLLASPTSSLSVDDRSVLLQLLRDYALLLGQKDLAIDYAKQQQTLLDHAARSADGPYMASTYNWPRAEVYHFLGEAQSLIPELVASEAALPDNYDPPYRLAWIYHQLGREDEALAAAKRSLALAQGPRRARIEALIVEIEAARAESARSPQKR